MTSRTHAFIAVAAIALAAVTGCGSLGNSAGANAGAPSSAPSAAADPAPSTAASAMCTTHTCIAQDLDQSLVGDIAEDEAVATKVTCYKSTVKFHAAADSYSATCVVEYSDGSSATGTGNVVVKQQKVTFEPNI